MSDLEKTGQNVPDDSAIVVVETGPSSDSRNKLFRPTELQKESSDSTRLRSKAPVVSSLSNDVKIEDFPATNDPVEAMVLKDSHHRSPVLEKHSTVSGSSGKHTQRASKKSSSKRQAAATPVENISLNDLDSEPIKKEISGIAALPIPADVTSITTGSLDVPTKGEEKRTDELNDEVAELRTPQTTEKFMDWSTRPEKIIKKVSWNDSEYLEKVNLHEPCLNTILEKKVSAVPSFRTGMPCNGPSGITIFLPAKTGRILDEPKNLNSGICLTVSKKSGSRFRINSTPAVEELKNVDNYNAKGEPVNKNKPLQSSR